MKPLGNQLSLYLCTLSFPVGYLVWRSFFFFESIPPKIYKLWHYPVGKEMPDLDFIDLSRIVVIQFMFPKYAKDWDITKFNAKAPLAMDLGHLFFLFINDYQIKNPTKRVEYIDEKGKPYGWMFYTQKRWWQRKRYLDPDLTFIQNSIIENRKIVAIRINEEG
jgi:hypothetical protein